MSALAESRAETAAPVIVHGDANPWNRVRYGAPRKSAEFATAFFPTGDHAAPIREERVMILELFDGLGAAVVTVDSADVPRLGRQFQHVLPLARLASPDTYQRKRDAYAARLSTVPAGNCPLCWIHRGRAIAALSPELCAFADRHPAGAPWATRKEAAA